MFNSLHKHKTVELQVFDETTPVRVSYDFFRYLAKLVSYIPDNILAWENHLCLNTLSNEVLKQLIIDNLPKFLWDIGSALHGLHVNNIAHGDCSIDNIAIRDGNFVLFDFDLSCRLKGIFDLTLKEHDFYRFINSIKYNFDKDWKMIKKKIPNNYNSTFFLNDLIIKFPTTDFAKPIALVNTEDVL